MLMFPSKTQAIVNWAYKKHSLELINKQRIIPNMTGDAIYEQNGKIMRRFGYYLHMRCPKHFTNWMHRGRYNRHSNATFTLSHYFINRHSIQQHVHSNCIESHSCLLNDAFVFLVHSDRCQFSQQRMKYTFFFVIENVLKDKWSHNAKLQLALIPSNHNKPNWYIIYRAGKSNRHT